MPNPINNNSNDSPLLKGDAPVNTGERVISPPSPVVPPPGPGPVPVPTSPPAPVTVKPFNPLNPIATPNTTPPPQPVVPVAAPLPPLKPTVPVPVNLPPINNASSVSSSPPEIPIQKSPFRFIIPILGIGIIIVIAILGVQKILQSKQSAGSDGVATSQTNKITTVTYWGLWESSTVMKEIFTKFESQNPDIKVNYQQQSIKDYRERLQNALKNGEGPDIYRFHLTWTPMLVSYLSPIPSTVMSAADFESQQYPIAQTWLKSTKGYVGIPLMYEGLGLFYNQTVLEAAGKTPPKTWEELRRMASELTIRNKQGEIQRSGIALGTTSNVDNWSDILGLLMIQNNADPGKPNNPLGQDALIFYTKFSESDKVWDDTMPTSTVAFANEKTAMIIAPSWRALEIKNMNPELKFNIAPVPQLPGSEVTWGSFWVEGVSVKSDKTKQTAAWKLLRFLNQPDILREWYSTASQERLFGEIYARKDMADQLKTDPYVSSLLEQAPQAKTWYMCSRTFDNGPNDKIIKYYEDAVNAVNQNNSAAEALTTVEQGITQVMNQYQLPQSTSTAR